MIALKPVLFPDAVPPVPGVPVEAPARPSIAGISSGEYVDRPADQVEAELRERGFTRVTVRPSGGPGAASNRCRVTSVTPAGLLSTDTPIAVSCDLP